MVVSFVGDDKGVILIAKFFEIFLFDIIKARCTTSSNDWNDSNLIEY